MKAKPGLNALTAIVLFVISVSFLTVSGAAASGKTDRESILRAYGKMPLSFIENKGQLDSKVRFYVKTSAQTLYFTDEGIVFDLLRRENIDRERVGGPEKERFRPGEKLERLVFRLGFENAREGVLIEGLDRQEGGINFFIGNDRRRWRIDVPAYRGIVYKDIYEGIDLKIFGNGNDIEYEFIVNPGANPEDILLTYNGIEGLDKNAGGELLIATAFGELKESKPYFYQEIGGERAVDGSFEILSSAGQSQPGKFFYGFRVASYDPSYLLIIDPVLTYSTYLGGTGGDTVGTGIAVNTSGNAYVTGYTTSANFPTVSAFLGTFVSSYDVFVTKLSSAGDSLVYSTYLGGSNIDYANGIAINTTDNAYVTGYTNSTNFPMSNAYQGSNRGGYDAFIAKLSTNGTALDYSTYLGGSDSDYGHGIAVDASGNAYVIGETATSENAANPFPIMNAHQSLFGGVSDAFVAKLSSNGSTLSYSTYLGGTNFDSGYGIAVDASDNAYVTGYTTSTDFPTATPYQAALRGTADAFVAKLSSAGNGLSYSTYLGGHSFEAGYAIAVDVSGSAYVTGETSSATTTNPNNIPFPTTPNAFQPAHGGGGGIFDAFVTKFSTNGSSLTYSTFLGGSKSDSGSAIAVNGSGYAYVAGYTASGDFPQQSSIQPTMAGMSDAFITKFSPDGSAVSYSTYLGGSSDDSAEGIAVEAASDFAYVTGLTYSTDFPTQNPYQGTNPDLSSAFVTEIDGAAATLPMVNSKAVTVTGSSATSGGKVTSDGGATVTVRGVCWSTSLNPTTADSHTTNGTGEGAFDSVMTALSANTTYHVRAYATNSIGTSYGSDITFSTAAATVPTVTTTGVTGINLISATSGGDVTSDGGATVTARGVCWSTTPDPTTADSFTLEGTGVGTFTSTMTNLIRGTTYHVRAYATNSLGTSYGSDITFSMGFAVVPTVTTTAVSGITSTSATSGGTVTFDGGRAVTARGVCWSTSPNPTKAGSFTVDGTGVGTFSSTMTNLTPGNFYHVRAYATNSLGTSYGSDLTFYTASVPTVATAAVTVTAGGSTATSGGDVTSEGAAAVLARGVCWSISPNPTTANNLTVDGTGVGTFSSTMTNLVPATTYHVRAYATNNFGTSYGADLTFYIPTAGAATPPTVTTTAVTGITSASATSGGTVTFDGGAAVTARGVCWSTAPNPTTADSFTLNGSGVGPFTSTMANLNQGTIYHVRAYATNSFGTSYGADLTFSTVGAATVATVTTTAVTGISAAFATSQGNVNLEGGATVTARGVCWSTSPNPTTADGLTVDGTGPGTFTSTMTNLTPETTYHVRAYATNSFGTGYGNDGTFSTAAATVPTVTTTAVTGITATSATGGGDVASDGGATVTARGVCWSTTPNPTTADSFTLDGTGLGTFISAMTGISPGTSYHVRAYATSIMGTGYGSDIMFWGQPFPPCPECAGDPVNLTNVIFPSGTECTCEATTSVTIGSGVTIENGAKINFKAPSINVQSGATIQSGAIVNMRQTY